MEWRSHRIFDELFPKQRFFDLLSCFQILEHLEKCSNKKKTKRNGHKDKFDQADYIIRILSTYVILQRIFDSSRSFGPRSPLICITWYLIHRTKVTDLTCQPHKFREHYLYLVDVRLVLKLNRYSLTTAKICSFRLVQKVVTFLLYYSIQGSRNTTGNLRSSSSNYWRTKRSVSVLKR